MGVSNQHALVLGASMGGLLAARVMSEHYDTVTVLEQDQLPRDPQHRRGVPQSRHTHGLLAGGSRALERLFPGLIAELMAEGAIPGDIVRDGRWIHEGAPLKRFTSGLDGLLVSRPLLEHAVRKRVTALPNVQFVESARVLRLSAAARGTRVNGVICNISGLQQEIAADITVDATGRGSSTPEWLSGLGYPPPPVERVEIALGYTTRLFRRLPEHLGGDLIVVIPPLGRGRQGGVMVAQEGGRWTVTLTSRFGDYAPEDLDGFREFARRLHAKDIYEVIRDAEPLGEARSGRFPASVWRRFDRLDRFPDGYLAFGDSICSFNPIYGQGMSVAALEALELDAVLNAGADGLAPRFFKSAAKIIQIPWRIAVGGDLKLPQVRAKRTAVTRFMNWYISKLHKAAHHDPELSMAFHSVANLLAPPESLVHPAVMKRVIVGNLWPRHVRSHGRPMVSTLQSRMTG